MQSQRTVPMTVAAVVMAVLVIGAVVVAAVLTQRGTDPVTSPVPSSTTPAPVTSDEPTTHATIVGVIAALPTSGSDDIYHLAVEGSGWLPIHVPANVEPLTGVPVTVTVAVPSTVIVAGTTGERFRALEDYVSSRRGLTLEVVAVSR